MKKKLLSLLLVFTMIITLMPVTANGEMVHSDLNEGLREKYDRLSSKSFSTQTLGTHVDMEPWVYNEIDDIWEIGYRVEPGDLFDITIWVEDFTDFYGGSIDLKYDDNILELIPNTDGKPVTDENKIFGDQEPLINRYHPDDPTIIQYTNLLVGQTAGISGDYALLGVIRFRVKDGVQPQNYTFNISDLISDLDSGAANIVVKLANSNEYPISNAIDYNTQPITMEILDPSDIQDEIVLDWSTDQDLDLDVFLNVADGQGGYYDVYYGNRGTLNDFPNALLLNDDYANPENNYTGKEVILFNTLNPGTELWVRAYGDIDLSAINGSATVTVKKGTETISFDIADAFGTGNEWYVFTVDNNGDLIANNQITPPGSNEDPECFGEHIDVYTTAQGYRLKLWLPQDENLTPDLYGRLNTYDYDTEELTPYPDGQNPIIIRFEEDYIDSDGVMYEARIIEDLPIGQYVVELVDEFYHNRIGSGNFYMSPMVHITNYLDDDIPVNTQQINLEGYISNYDKDSINALTLDLNNVITHESGRIDETGHFSIPVALKEGYNNILLEFHFDYPTTVGGNFAETMVNYVPSASGDATVTSSQYLVDHTNNTIINIPYGTDLTVFKSNITPAAGAAFEVYESDGITVANDLQTGYKVIVTAEDGVTSKTYEITVDSVTDVVPPTATVNYSITAPTNQDVVVTIVPSEPVIVTNNGGSMSYTFIENGTFTFTFEDLAGNTGTVTAAVNNIDKTAPTGTITYSTTAPTNEPVVVTLNPNEDVTVTNNGGAMTYTFTQNGTFTFEFKDPAGNTGTTTAVVNNIEVIVGNNDATVSSSVYVVDHTNNTITNIPSGTDLAAFKSNITPAAGAAFEVYESDGITVATDLQTGYRVIVTAEDGVTVKSYTCNLETGQTGSQYPIRTGAELSFELYEANFNYDNFVWEKGNKINASDSLSPGDRVILDIVGSGVSGATGMELTATFDNSRFSVVGSVPFVEGDTANGYLDLYSLIITNQVIGNKISFNPAPEANAITADNVKLGYIVLKVNDTAEDGIATFSYDNTSTMTWNDGQGNQFYSLNTVNYNVDISTDIEKPVNYEIEESQNDNAKIVVYSNSVGFEEQNIIETVEVVDNIAKFSKISENETYKFVLKADKCITRMIVGSLSQLEVMNFDMLLKGDIVDDDAINYLDFLELKNVYNTNSTIGDLNDTNNTDYLDFLILKRNYQQKGDTVQ